MPIRNATPLTFMARGVCDAIDATPLQPGAMLSLANLMPNPVNLGQFVPRPAATQASNFASFTTPAGGEALLILGSRAYGMIASSRFAGKSEPFCYDLAAGAFVTIGGATAANCPVSQPTIGDTPPASMAMVGNRIMVTHPGYDGVNTFIGWIDIRSFTWAGATGSTHSSTLVDTLSSNPITAGVEVGDGVAGAGITAGTTVTALTPTSITLSQAATATAAGIALTFTSGTRAAPTYGAGQTNGTALTAVPRWVLNFNGRAYYAVKNGMQFSDALIPTQITNATQQLTCGDDVNVTCLAGLPLANPIAGGVLAGLIAFKEDGPYWLVTGDISSTDEPLKLNEVNGSVGTRAPLSVVATPKGLLMAAPDGLRLIGFDGTTSDPIGADGDGITLAFRYAVNPTRMCAAYDKGVYRVTVQNGYKDGQPVEEYWLHIKRGIFTGPHSFPMALIAPYRNGSNTFIGFGFGINGKLWQSKSQADATTTYTENGVALTWTWAPTLLPDNQALASNQIVDSTIAMALPAIQATTITAMDETGTVLDTVALAGDNNGGAIWGGFTWGGTTWGGKVASFRQYQIKWHQPLVFKQLNLQITGQSQSGFSIGNFYTEYQITGYVGAYLT